MEQNESANEPVSTSGVLFVLFISKQVNLCFSMPNYGINFTLNAKQHSLWFSWFISKARLYVSCIWSESHSHEFSIREALLIDDDDSDNENDERNTLVVINLFVIGKYLVDMLVACHLMYIKNPIPSVEFMQLFCYGIRRRPQLFVRSFLLLGTLRIIPIFH